jgi:hypothetical protein
MQPIVTRRLCNDAGGVYFVRIQLPREQAAQFLLDLWVSFDVGWQPSDAEQALEELTDRMRCFRTSFNDFDGICIRTHAWNPCGDTRTLHDGVLTFLRQRGLDV